MRRLVLLAIALSVIVAVVSWFARESPDEALRRFYTADVPEALLMDPLIRQGDRIVPLLMTAITDRNMHRRGYAILSLGHIGSNAPLPVLRKILLDTSEESHTRASALEAIALIDSTEGLSLAHTAKDAEGPLGIAARQLLQPGTHRLTRRTWWQAFRGTD